MYMEVPAGAMIVHRSLSMDTRPYLGKKETLTPPRAGRSPYVASVTREVREKFLQGLFEGISRNVCGTGQERIWSLAIDIHV